MNVDAQKLEIIEWVSRLQDSQIVQELLKFREKKMVQGKKRAPRKLGDGKYLISYIAEDFNDPIDHFKDYEPSTNKTIEHKLVERNFDDGKHIFTYVAEDFNEPLEDFKEYME